MLTGTVAVEGVKAVAGRVAQVVQRFRRLDHRQLDKRAGLDVRRQVAAALALPYSLCFSVFEAGDHRNLITAFAT
jgi:hypothetical protein